MYYHQSHPRYSFRIFLKSWSSFNLLNFLLNSLLRKPMSSKNVALVHWKFWLSSRTNCWNLLRRCISPDNIKRVKLILILCSNIINFKQFRDNLSTFPDVVWSFNIFYAISQRGSTHRCLNCTFYHDVFIKNFFFVSNFCLMSII